MKHICKIILFALLVGLAVSAQAQVVAPPSTTLTISLGGGRPETNGKSQACFTLASLGSGSTTITPGIQGNKSGTYLLVDQELMQVYSVNTATTGVCADRGVQGTKQKGHLSGATVFYSQFSTGGTPGTTAFSQNDPSGWCSTAFLAFNPIYSTVSGKWFTCPGAPATWAISTDPLNPAFGGVGIQSSASLGGTPVTLTSAQCGQAFALDAATGVVYILPATLPPIGCVFDFYVTTSVTSNSDEIETGAAAHFFQGTPTYVVGAGGNAAAFYCNGTSHIAFKTNGTTTGGLQGSHIKVTVISPTVAVLDGLNSGSGTLATACSTTN
jgi:hypothetical protein